MEDIRIDIILKIINDDMCINYEKSVLNKQPLSFPLERETQNFKEYFWCIFNEEQTCKNIEIKENTNILFLNMIKNKCKKENILVKIKKVLPIEDERVKEQLKSLWKGKFNQIETCQKLYILEHLTETFSLEENLIKAIDEKTYGELCLKFNDIDENLKLKLIKEIKNKDIYGTSCINQNSLKFEKFLINSFYNSLKTKGFVILAGLSGTGKTKIFEEFVKCFPYTDKNRVEKWIVIKETGEKLIPIKKETIEFNNGNIHINSFIKSINDSLGTISNRKIVIKLKNYYTELVPTIEKLKNYTNLIGSEGITNHLAVYIASLFGFEIIEKSDIERLGLKILDKKIEIKELYEEFNNHLFLPIRPDFKDSKSLLGYYNPLKKKYHSTPLLDFILKASKNYLEKGENADPFFVLFDEMNLARVEYYFADFLSVLEAKRFPNGDEALKNSRFLEYVNFLNFDLTDKNYKFTSQSIKLHNEENIDIPKEIFLPPNLYFIGTVNIDETTYTFSPKVLDRAFTIEFDVGNFTEYLEFLKENKTEEIYDELKLKEDFTNNGEFATINKEKIKEFLENNSEIVNFLNKINSTLRRYNLHFGYRVFDEIIMFLYNSENSIMNINNNEALDLAIKMKVLPKFNGTRQKLEKPIMEFLEILEINKEEAELLIENGIPTLNKVAEKTNFKHTAYKLLEMLYKVKSQGFASFI